MSETIQIALVDDEPAVLDSTRMVLGAEGITARPFESAKACLEALEGGLQVRCIVSDVRMPGMTGLDFQAELVRRSVTVPLILITGPGEVSMAVQALKAGAVDFIEKPFDPAILANSIRKAVEDQAKTELAAANRQEVIARATELSGRQREVMHFVAEGYSNKQIAAKLGISVRTVETYRLWVMEKMGAGSVAALVRMVMLLPPEDRAP